MLLGVLAGLAQLAAQVKMLGGASNTMTRMPRAASISSTIRRPSGNRKYNQMAWLMTSAGKRWRANQGAWIGFIPHGLFNPGHPSVKLTMPLARQRESDLPMRHDRA